MRLPKAYLMHLCELAGLSAHPHETSDILSARLEGRIRHLVYLERWNRLSPEEREWERQKAQAAQ